MLRSIHHEMLNFFSNRLDLFIKSFPFKMLAYPLKVTLFIQHSDGINFRELKKNATLNSNKVW